MNQTSYVVNELESAVTICVDLVGRLDRTIPLQLIFQEGTASTSDFNDTILTFAFESGTSTGDVQCNDIRITQDGIVEDTEMFRVELIPNPPAEDVRINITTAEVSVQDSLLDGKNQACVFLISFK